MVDIENVIRLSKKILEIRMLCQGGGTSLIATYHWDIEKDLRITSIKRLTRLMIGLNVSFLYLSNSDQNKILEGVKSFFEEGKDIEQYLLMNEIFLKIGFTSSLFFIVERVLRSYLRFLDEKIYANKRNSIKMVCSCLLEEKLKWENAGFVCNTFDFFRLTRNTLHNNGVHIPMSEKEKDVPIEYKGKMYEFLDGERINFVTWDLLLDIADEMRQLLMYLASNRTISSIPDLIPDTVAV